MLGTLWFGFVMCLHLKNNTWGTHERHCAILSIVSIVHGHLQDCNGMHCGLVKKCVYTSKPVLSCHWLDEKLVSGYAMYVNIDVLVTTPVKSLIRDTSKTQLANTVSNYVDVYFNTLAALVTARFCVDLYLIWPPLTLNFRGCLLFRAWRCCNFRNRFSSVQSLWCCTALVWSEVAFYVFWAYLRILIFSTSGNLRWGRKDIFFFFGSK